MFSQDALHEMIGSNPELNGEKMSFASSTFNGVVAASITPFNPDYTIDRVALSENIRFIAKQPGIRGLLVNGLAAEVTSLTRTERTDIVSLVRKEVGDGYPVISGISAQSTHEAIEMVKETTGAGATALLVTAPSLFARGGASHPEAPVHFFRALAEESKVPLLVFQHQTSSGLCYPAKTLVRICSIPNVIGIKSTVWDEEVYEREWAELKTMANPPLVLSGNDTLLLSNFTFGCDGAILGIANLLPGPIVEIFELAQSGNLKKAKDVYLRILPLVHAIYQPPAFGYYSKVKEAMVMLGMLTGATVRPPLMPITEGERSSLREALKLGGLL